MDNVSNVDVERERERKTERERERERETDRQTDRQTKHKHLRCSPTEPNELKPTERYGAGAVFHASSHTFYIFGGLAWTGTMFSEMNDMWVSHLVPFLWTQRQHKSKHARARHTHIPVRMSTDMGM